MPFAITLRLDEATAAHVAELWKTLADHGFGGTLRLGYAPHVTLAICPDGTSETALLAAIARVAGAADVLKLCFDSLGVFTGEARAVFLAPITTPELLELHEATLEALTGLTVSAFYERGRWVPHVTLAKQLVSAADAIRALEGVPLPIRGCLDRIDLVQFRPVRVLASHALRASGLYASRPGGSRPEG